MTSQCNGNFFVKTSVYKMHLCAIFLNLFKSQIHCLFISWVSRKQERFNYSCHALTAHTTELLLFGHLKLKKKKRSCYQIQFSYSPPSSFSRTSLHLFCLRNKLVTPWIAMRNPNRISHCLKLTSTHFSAAAWNQKKTQSSIADHVILTVNPTSEPFRLYCPPLFSVCIYLQVHVEREG